MVTLWETGNPSRMYLASCPILAVTGSSHHSYPEMTKGQIIQQGKCAESIHTHPVQQDAGASQHVWKNKRFKRRGPRPADGHRVWYIIYHPALLCKLTGACTFVLSWSFKGLATKSHSHIHTVPKQFVILLWGSLRCPRSWGSIHRPNALHSTYFQNILTVLSLNRAHVKVHTGQWVMVLSGAADCIMSAEQAGGPGDIALSPQGWWSGF